MSAADWSIRLARADDAEHSVDVEQDAAQVLRSAPELAGFLLPPTHSVSDYQAMIAFLD